MTFIYLLCAFCIALVYLNYRLVLNSYLSSKWNDFNDAAHWSAEEKRKHGGPYKKWEIIDSACLEAHEAATTRRYAPRRWHIQHYPQQPAPYFWWRDLFRHGYRVQLERYSPGYMYWTFPLGSCFLTIRS